jgi:hypothetical protein
MGRGWVRCRVLRNVTQPQPNPYLFTTLLTRVAISSRVVYIRLLYKSLVLLLNTICLSKVTSRVLITLASNGI